MRIIQTPQNNPDSSYVLKETFSKEEVDKIISQVKDLPITPTTLGAADGTTVKADKGIRSSVVKWIPETEEWAWVYQRMIDVAVKANNAAWRFDLVAALEQIQYTEYPASEKGHYDWHIDIGIGDTPCKRKVSMTVQLSDSNDYEGGDLLILKGSDGNGKLTYYETCSRDKGGSTLFPSYLLHRVTPVTKGVRKSLVLWIGGSQFR
tara:strand:+ start:427 stop:1044 length:618 start_codon:yes stop_codon:yes gene_type:complete